MSKFSHISEASHWSSVPSGPERSRAVPSGPERSRVVPSGPERSRAVPSGPERSRVVPSRPDRARAVLSDPSGLSGPDMGGFQADPLRYTNKPGRLLPSHPQLGPCNDQHPLIRVSTFE